MLTQQLRQIAASQTSSWPCTGHRVPCGRSAAVLARAVQLSSVCKLWRQAALLAAGTLPQLDLHCSGTSTIADAQWLTPLLADLLTGRRLHLCGPLHDAPNVPGKVCQLCGVPAVDRAWPQHADVLCPAAFLQRAKPTALTTGRTPPASAEFWDTLEALACSSLRHFGFGDADEDGTWAGCAFPARLRSLGAYLSGAGAAWNAAEMLQSAQDLACLERLSLAVCDTFEMKITAPQLRLSHLKELKLDLEFKNGADCWDLSALHAARQGVRVAVTITVDPGGANFTSKRTQILWRSLAQVPLLDELHLKDYLCISDSVSAAEQQLLASVRCKHLVVHNTPGWMPYAEALMQSACCSSVTCQYVCTGQRTKLDWDWLAAAGIHVIDGRATLFPYSWDSRSLAVYDCDNIMPDHAQPWAIVLQLPGHFSVQGMPLSRFLPGPQGHLVWRNRYVSDSDLEVALARLHEETLMW